jgi:hypothetical protein
MPCSPSDPVADGSGATDLTDELEYGSWDASFILLRVRVMRESDPPER